MRSPVDIGNGGFDVFILWVLLSYLVDLAVLG